MSHKPLIVAASVAIISAVFALVVAYGILDSVDVSPEVQPKPRGIMGLPPAPNCDPLYNTGRHRAWARCMGVEYVRPTRETIGKVRPTR